MSKSKIQHWEANRIAESIADKAFEHLRKPLEARQQRALRTAYDGIISMLDVQALIACGMLKESGSIRLLVTPKESLGYLIAEENEALLLVPSTYDLFVTYEKDIASIRQCKEELAPIRKQQDSLKETLQKQIENKSAKHVMKTWPEVAGLVAKFFEIDPCTGADSSMTQPLEALLAQFLTPLLAAPQPEGV